MLKSFSSLSSPANELLLNQGLFFRNRLFNGNFGVAQRGTSFVAGLNNDDTYNLDRWYVLSDGNDVVDITQETSVVPSTAATAIALDVETTNAKFGVAQIIESKNCLGLVGNIVTLSFDAKVSATTDLDNIKCAIVAWSGTADTVTSDIVSAWNVEGTNPTLIANATYENTPANLGVTTSWQKFSVTANIDTANTKNVIVFIWSDVTTTTAGDFLYVTNVQLETGNVATAFDLRPFAAETQLCQRYYYRTTAEAAGAIMGGAGYAVNTTVARGIDYFPVTMRIAPTALEQTGTATDYRVFGGGAVATVCSAVPTFNSATVNWGRTSMTVAAGLTTYNGSNHGAALGLSAPFPYLGWSAEL
jgi:hypothetical protein